ncbi:chromosome partitioning protein, ParB family [Calothrix sp. NIES-2100]|uniref:ParB/RepB/Spo0J family partition protein n=1 Tax=Calothrix sp. NIES-2100 TaxID=1954172 RepID=UPI000B616674|nr:chromosome partitioning protein, ParB family [Calothrix sp. NIES-2100]
MSYRVTTTQGKSIKITNPGTKNATKTKKEALQDVTGTTVLPIREEETSALAAKLVPLSMIVMPATQPRHYFDTKGMQSLIESVRTEGILQPLLVRKVADKYELVAGERKYRAAKKCSLKEVPVTIREMSDIQAIQYALIENLQRENLNPVEETEGILDLLALRLSSNREGVVSLLNKLSKAKRGVVADNDVRSETKQILAEVFASVGKMSSESFRTHRLPLLNLPNDILDALRSGEIEYTKAREIGKVESESERIELLSAAIEYDLSINQIREKVKALQPPSVGMELQKLLESTYKRVKKFKVWSNIDKQEKLKHLLAELEALITAKEINLGDRDPLTWVGHGDLLVGISAQESGTVDQFPSLSSKTLDLFRREAIDLWKQAGLDGQRLAQLENVTLQVADLPDAQLGLTSGQIITIDVDAAGRRWFIDPTPKDNIEFNATFSQDAFWAKADNAAAGKVDLLTVITHEMGHVLGIPHLDNHSNSVMSTSLPVGGRRLPTSGDLTYSPFNYSLFEAEEKAKALIQALMKTVHLKR